MKNVIALLLITISLSSSAQDEPTNADAEVPLFALLNKVKNGGEDALRSLLIEQQLALDTITDEPKGNKRKATQQQKNFESNKKCNKAYNDLRSSTDQLITQLKADLTMTNKKRLLRKLNDNSDNAQSWYRTKTDEIIKQYAALKNCLAGTASAASLEALTGLFTALVGIVTSARDFRALQIKSLCDQLEALRMVDSGGLLNPGAKEKSNGTSKEDDKEEK